MYSQMRRELDDGEIPLLTRSQLRFLDEVRAITEERVSYYASFYLCDDDDDENTLDLKLLITAAENNLMTIIKRLKDARRSKLRFAETYPKWKRNREDCIVKLKDIADSINSDRFKCNVSKLVGYCTSLVGGGVCLASAFLIPFTLGLTTPLAIGGGSLLAAGGSTAIGTSITEMALLKSKVEKAKKLIEEDKKYFEDLSDWLTHASELQEALSDVLNIDVVKDLVESTRDFVERAIKIKTERERSGIIKRTINQILQDYMPKFVEMSVPVIAIATFITVLVSVFLLLINTDNRLGFDFASLTVRAVLGIASLLDDSMDVIRLSALFAGKGAAAKIFAKAVTRGAVAVVGMALDAVGIVFVSMDLHNGSLSPEADKIIKAIKSMTEETDVLNRVYANISP